MEKTRPDLLSHLADHVGQGPCLVYKARNNPQPIQSRDMLATQYPRARGGLVQMPSWVRTGPCVIVAVTGSHGVQLISSGSAPLPCTYLNGSPCCRGDKMALDSDQLCVSATGLPSGRTPPAMLPTRLFIPKQF